MKRTFTAILFIMSTSLATLSEVPEKFFVDSVPKSGTHLVTACIKKIAPLKHIRSKVSFYVMDPAVIQNLKAHDFYFTHAPCVPYNESLVNQYNMKGIYIYRDPRDVLLSTANWIKERKEWPHLRNLSLDEILTKLIINFNSYLSFPHAPKTPTITSVYKLYQPWQNNRHVYTTTFERLVGPQGGGSAQAQYTEINNIAKHLGVSLSQEQIHDIAKSIFGKTLTFRKGQIGSGKQYLNARPALKRLFKEVAGRLLIELGYEKNLNW